MSIEFPVQLKHYFQQHQSENDAHILPDFFEKNPGVMDAFINWTKEHQVIVHHTPRLYKALDTAMDFGGQGIAYRVHNLYLTATTSAGYSNYAKSVLNSIIDQTTFPQEFFQAKVGAEPFERAFELYEAGIINTKQLFKVLTSSKRLFELPAEHFRVLIPYFEKLNYKDLVKLLSLKVGGDSILYHKDADQLSPLIKTLNPQDFLKIMKIIFNQDNMSDLRADFLRSKERCRAIFPIVEKMDYHEKMTFFTLKNLPRWGTSFEVFAPLLAEFDFADFFKIISQSAGYFPEPEIPYIFLMHSFFLKILPILEKLKFQDFLKVITMERNGKKICEMDQYFNYLVPLLVKQNVTDLTKILSIKDQNGQPLSHNFERLKLLAPFFEKLPSSDIVTHLCLKNSKGTTFICDQFPIAYPLLYSLDTEDLNHLFSLQDRHGNTFLHNFSIWKFLHDPSRLAETKFLLGKLDPKIFLIQNERGLTAAEEATVNPSEKWLVQDKHHAASQEISDSDYPKRAGQLKEAIKAMVASFIFSDEKSKIQKGAIPLEYLLIRISGDNKKFTPSDIDHHLEIMLDKIINKTAWLGTPKEEDATGLHKFYSQMLLNFEQVMTALQDTSIPEDKRLAMQAGVLIGIAKVQMEGRCAAAYQSEIEQAKIILDANASQEASGLGVTFSKFMNASLTSHIERLVREDYNGDSHAFSQFLFATGLGISSDPLSPVTLEDSQHIVLRSWKKEGILDDFQESLKQLNPDTLRYWFYENTPDEFEHFIVSDELEDNEPQLNGLKQQASIKEGERTIIAMTENFLKSKQLDEKMIDKALKFFQSAGGGQLKGTSLPQVKNLSAEVVNAFANATKDQDVEDAMKIYNKLTADDKSRRLALQELIDQAKVNGHSGLQALIKERTELMQKSINMTRELEPMKLYARTRIGLIKELSIFSENDLRLILDAKKSFDKAVADLSEKFKVNFTAAESGLPSLAMEHARRTAYADQSINTPKGALQILLSIGVFEKNSQ